VVEYFVLVFPNANPIWGTSELEEAGMRGSMLCLAISLIIPFTGSPLAAQAEESPSNLGWATLGLLGAGGGGAGVVVWGLEASFQRGVHLFSARALGSGELEGVGTEAWEAALLYGRALHGRRHHSSLSVGIAFLSCQWGSVCGDGEEPGPEDPGYYDSYESDYQKTVGLALSGQTFWAPSRYFGIGLWGFANINPTQSYVGAMLGLRFGKLR
jgi:hypothetical protein